jgi:hypothetical protein
MNPLAEYQDHLKSQGLIYQPKPHDVHPLWSPNTSFNVYCYFSSSKQLKLRYVIRLYRNLAVQLLTMTIHSSIASIREVGSMLWTQEDFLFDSSFAEKIVDLTITDVANRSSSSPNTYIASDNFWSKIHSNSTSIYLHVLAMKSGSLRIRYS